MQFIKLKKFFKYYRYLNGYTIVLSDFPHSECLRQDLANIP